MKNILLVFVLGLVVLSSCTKENLAPIIEFSSPEQTINLEENMEVEMGANLTINTKITDEQIVSEAKFYLQKNQEERKELTPLTITSEVKDKSFRVQLDFDESEFKVGDVVAFIVKASDQAGGRITSTLVFKVK